MDKRDLERVRADDELVDWLAAGHGSPEATDDEVAGLLAQLRDEARADMPPAPEYLAGPPEPRRGWVAGLIGAAAATLIIAVSGVVLQTTGLIGGQRDQAMIVAPASTLGQLQDASANGDKDAAQRLLDEAQKLVDGIKDKNSAQAANGRLQRSIPTTVTVTQTPEPGDGTDDAPAPVPPEPSPETLTVTQIMVVTTTVAPPAATVEPQLTSSPDAAPATPSGSRAAEPAAG